MIGFGLARVSFLSGDYASVVNLVKGYIADMLQGGSSRHLGAATLKSFISYKVNP